MGAVRYPRGAAGGKRDMRNKHHAGRVRAREMNKRVQGALEKARSARHALDARIAAEQAVAISAGPLLLAVLEEQARHETPAEPTQAEFVAAMQEAIPEMAERFGALAEADPSRWTAGTGRWTLQDAVDLLEAGYQLQQVVRKTGWGAGWFQDDFQFEGGYLA